MQIILHVVAQTNTSIHILLLFFSVKNKQEGFSNICAWCHYLRISTMLEIVFYSSIQYKEI